MWFFQAFYYQAEDIITLKSTETESDRDRDKKRSKEKIATG